MKLAGYLHEIDKAEVADSGVKAATERYYKAASELQEEVEERVERALRGDRTTGGFLENELVFAASFRCSCGAGMAYPDGIGSRGSWYCSAILTNEAKQDVEHTPAHPFIFYEVKSEEQPSQHGATTRPATSRIEISPWYVCTKCGHSGIGESYKPHERKDIKACEKCGASRYRDDYPGALSNNLKVRYFATAYLRNGS